VSDRPHVEGDPDGIPSRYVARIYQALEEHETRAAERDTRRDAALTRQLDEIRESLALLAPLPAQVTGLQARLDELDGRTETIEARERREAERDELRRELTAQGWGPLPTHPGVLVESAGQPMRDPASLAHPGPRTPIADGVGELLGATARHLPIILAIVSVIAGLATGGTVVGLEAARMVLEEPAAAPAPTPEPTPEPPMLPDVAPVDTGPAIEGDTGAHGDGAAQGDTHQVRAR
jgi:hypothetical protein